MLSWLNRGGGDGRDNDLDGPDTPAPVFAAKAIRNAFFGTPARPDSAANGDDAADAVPTTSRASAVLVAEATTPTKTQPEGILRTPGTGTAKNKRVSFGRDVISDNGSRTSLSSISGSTGGRFSGPWGGGKRTGRKTRLTELLEGARKEKGEKGKRISLGGGSTASMASTTTTTTTATPSTEEEHKAEDAGGDKNEAAVAGEGKPADDDSWEEDDDDDEDENENENEDEDDPDDDADPDITTDMNEPHSRSGKYWKAEFEKYRRDARAEMESLLKYRKLAKSYACEKDSLATELAEQLREEQQKVHQMERKITESASQMATRRRLKDPASRPNEQDDEDDTKALSEQTAEMLMYQARVQELEALLRKLAREHERDLLTTTSPRTARTLVETQKELRKARAQVRELGELRDQVKVLKSELDSVNRRAARHEEDNKRLAAENASLTSSLAKMGLGTDSSSRATTELRTRVRELEEEAKKKDDQLESIKAETEAIREESQSRDVAQRRVIEKLNVKLKETKERLRHAQGSVRNHDGERPRPHPAKKEEDKAPTIAQQDPPDNGYKPPRVQQQQHQRENQNQPSTTDEDDINQDLDKRVMERRASRTLRDKYKDGDSTHDLDAHQTLSRHAVPPVLLPDGVSLLDRPRWQKYIPRSPRNRAYMASIAATRSEGGGIDLLRHGFAGIGSAHQQPDYDDDGGFNDYDEGDTLANASRISRLDGPRRAAAIARIERKNLEKRKGAGSVMNLGAPMKGKENMRPFSNRR